MWAELTPELQSFREEIDAWISGNKPEGLDELVDWSTPWGTMGRHQLVEQARRHPLYKEWEQRLLGSALICPHWPASVGGRGWDPARLAVFDLACHEAHVSRIERGMGEWLVGPAVLLEGTDDQRAAFLPRIISGQDVYCQGFSEPNHGSDLAWSSAIASAGATNGCRGSAVVGCGRRRRLRAPAHPDDDRRATAVISTNAPPSRAAPTVVRTGRGSGKCRSYTTLNRWKWERSARCTRQDTTSPSPQPAASSRAAILPRRMTGVTSKVSNTG